jgi:hypothetical protein
MTREIISTPRVPHRRAPGTGERPRPTGGAQRRRHRLLPRRAAALACAASLLLAACATQAPRRGAAAGFAEGASREFTASLFLVDDIDQFFAAVQAPEDPVRIPVVSVASRGQNVAAFVAVSGCSANAAAVCDVRVDFEIRDPQGALVGKEEAAPLWREPPRPVPGKVLFGEVSVTVRLGSDAALGTWEVRAVIREEVAKESVDLRATFLVV